MRITRIGIESIREVSAFEIYSRLVSYSTEVTANEPSDESSIDEVHFGQCGRLDSTRVCQDRARPCAYEVCNETSETTCESVKARNVT